jgi:glycosyltransferase involved in cell wall biosynthesis
MRSSEHGRANGPVNALGLTVLITNLSMDWASGTVVYARDLALELQRQGHRPMVYTWLEGSASRELEAAGIEVFDDLWRIGDRPDVIHGHHRPLIRGALLRFPDVPVVAFCHNHGDPWDAPDPNPQIDRYFGVSHLCVKRLLDVGAPARTTGLQTNFVDLSRLPPRPPLPPRPTRALVFSNYASLETHLPVVQEACRRLEIPLDVIGRGVGRSSEHPELLLDQYDLVFAKAKAAMESMAVGAAVVLCDFGGLGPMVTAGEFERLRPLNFGFEALRSPLTADGVVREVERYDAADAGRVRDLVRANCGLEVAVTDLVEVYRQVIAESISRQASEASRPGRPGARRAAAFAYRASTMPIITFYRAFGLGPRSVPRPLGPPYRAVRAVVRRLVHVG